MREKKLQYACDYPVNGEHSLYIEDWKHPKDGNKKIHNICCSRCGAAIIKNAGSHVYSYVLMEKMVELNTYYS